MSRSVICHELNRCTCTCLDHVASRYFLHLSPLSVSTSNAMTAAIPMKMRYTTVIGSTDSTPPFRRSDTPTSQMPWSPPRPSGSTPLSQALGATGLRVLFRQSGPFTPPFAARRPRLLSGRSAPAAPKSRANEFAATKEREVGLRRLPASPRRRALGLSLPRFQPPGLRFIGPAHQRASSGRSFRAAALKWPRAIFVWQCGLLSVSDRPGFIKSAALSPQA
jgi:hypothetical protein